MGSESHVSGAKKLISIFGAWPSFHDAEVVDLHLWRGRVWPGDWDERNVFPVLTLSVRILEATQPGANNGGNDVLAKLRFHDVSDVKLDDFNHCNQIVGFSIEEKERGTFTDGRPLPPHLEVKLERGFGLSASFRCFRIEVLDAIRCTEDDLLNRK